MFNRILLRYVIRNKLKGVTVDEDLLRVEDSRVFIGKTELKREEILKLRAEADIFENSLLWRLMSNNVYWIANFKMMRGADKEYDMCMGRAMTANMDTIEEFINKLKLLK